MTTPTVQAYPLPEPYDNNTPQVVADALRAHIHARFDCPVLGSAAMAAADLIEKQAAEITQLRRRVQAIADYAEQVAAIGLGEDVGEGH